MCPLSGSSNVVQDLSLLQSASALSKAGCGNLGRRMYVFFDTFWSAPGNLDLLEIGADWLRSGFGFDECAIGFGNDSGSRDLRQSTNVCLALVDGRLYGFAHPLGREVCHPLSVGRNEGIEPYYR